MSPPPDEQPCDLRLFTPATCLIEFRAAAAQAIAQAQNLSQAAATAISNNNNNQPAATIGPVSTSPQLPFIKGLGLLPRTSLTTPQAAREHNERKYDQSRSSSGGSGNQLSPLSLTPIQSTVGAPYSCSRCGNTYARPHSLNRHIRFECGVEPKFECPVCHKKSKHRYFLRTISSVQIETNVEIFLSLLSDIICNYIRSILTSSEIYLNIFHNIN